LQENWLINNSKEKRQELTTNNPESILLGEVPMKEFFKKTGLAEALTAFGFLSAMGTAQAAIFEVDFTTSGVFSGTAPGSPPPTTTFATAVFDDHGGSGSVTLTMNVLNNLSAGAYVNDWYFNVSSAPMSSLPAFVSGVQASTVDNGVDAFKPDGSGFYDFAFHFPTGAPGELAQGNSSVYNLVSAGITAGSFNSPSTTPADPAHGPFISAIHVQGYTINGADQSAWIAGGGGGGGGAQIPEPATLALIGLGLFGIAATRRRRA
jgi:hypothetical protein